MAYTTYPSEASSFSSQAESLKGKLNNVETGLKDVLSILGDGGHNDFLSEKTLEANGKLIDAITSSYSTIEGDVSKVKKMADELEEAARLETEKLESEKKEDGEANEWFRL